MARLPSLAAVLGRWPDAEIGGADRLEPARGEGRMPLARAAVSWKLQAVSRPWAFKWLAKAVRAAAK